MVAITRAITYFVCTFVSTCFYITPAVHNTDADREGRGKKGGRVIYNNYYFCGKLGYNCLGVPHTTTCIQYAVLS